MPDQILETKHWWESKTIMVNILLGLVVALDAFTGATKDILPIPIYEALAIVLPALNTFLRTITNTGIKSIKEDYPANYPLD